MTVTAKTSRRQATHPAPDRLDLLPTHPSCRTFAERIKALGLKDHLEAKVLAANELEPSYGGHGLTFSLTRDEEKELATEVLLRRHNFTGLVAAIPHFRQAALSVIQNIYLFQQRRIFFAPEGMTHEEQRQHALLLLSQLGKADQRRQRWEGEAQQPTDCDSIQTIPLRYTFQHPIIARIWHRINQHETTGKYVSTEFDQLHLLVEELNSLRNCYVLLTRGLVRKLTGRLNRQQQTRFSEEGCYEDLVQIGSFGVARAAYRYHPSSAHRFSTFAAPWIYKELQRQTARNGLIRVSENNLHSQHVPFLSFQQEESLEYALAQISSETLASTEVSGGYFGAQRTSEPPENIVARQQLLALICKALELLTPTNRDILRRRFGLPPYEGCIHSVFEISQIYRVSRSSIYQREQTALRQLEQILSTSAENALSSAPNS